MFRQSCVCTLAEFHIRWFSSPCPPAVVDSLGVALGLFCACICLVSPMWWLRCEPTVPCWKSAAMGNDESSCFSRCDWSLFVVSVGVRVLVSPRRHRRSWVPRRPSATPASRDVLPVSNAGRVCESHARMLSARGIPLCTYAP